MKKTRRPKRPAKRRKRKSIKARAKRTATRFEEENEPGYWKVLYPRLDEHVLKAIHDDGFAFACLPIGQVDAPGPDFTGFLPHCGDYRSLVVCAPALTLNQAEQVIDGQSLREFDDGTRIKVVQKFCPACEDWLCAPPLIHAHFVGVDDPPFAPGGFEQQAPWILVAELTLTRAGAESTLFVIHLGAAREQAIWCFLVPNQLVPRLVIT